MAIQRSHLTWILAMGAAVISLTALRCRVPDSAAESSGGTAPIHPAPKDPEAAAAPLQAERRGLSDRFPEHWPAVDTEATFVEEKERVPGVVAFDVLVGPEIAGRDLWATLTRTDGDAGALGSPALLEDDERPSLSSSSTGANVTGREVYSKFLPPIPLIGPRNTDPLKFEGLDPGTYMLELHAPARPPFLVARIKEIQVGSGPVIDARLATIDLASSVRNLHVLLELPLERESVTKVSIEADCYGTIGEERAPRQSLTTTVAFAACGAHAGCREALIPSGPADVRVSASGFKPVLVQNAPDQTRIPLEHVEEQDLNP